MSQIIASKSPVISLSNSKINRIESSSIKRSSYTNAFKRMAIIHFDMTKSKNKFFCRFHVKAPKYVLK